MAGEVDRCRRDDRRGEHEQIRDADVVDCERGAYCFVNGVQYDKKTLSEHLSQSVHAEELESSMQCVRVRLERHMSYLLRLFEAFQAF